MCPSRYITAVPDPPGPVTAAATCATTGSRAPGSGPIGRTFTGPPSSTFQLDPSSRSTVAYTLRSRAPSTIRVPSIATTPNSGVMRSETITE